MVLILTIVNTALLLFMLIGKIKDALDKTDIDEKIIAYLKDLKDKIKEEVQG